ncbi:hypothetical protein ANCDUO_17589, partial [Ancylostoma duodenale]
MDAFRLLMGSLRTQREEEIAAMHNPVFQQSQNHHKCRSSTGIAVAPPIEVFFMNKMFMDETSPNKVNLTVG